jgi:hypothetical protein
MPIIHATRETEIRRIVEANPSKTLVRPPFQPISCGVLLHAYNPSYMGGIGRRVKV